MHDIVEWAEPPLTCPHIDKVLSMPGVDPAMRHELEQIKDINSQLRYGTWHLRAERDAAYRKGAEDMRERAAVLAEGPATDWGYYVGGTPERDKIAAAIRKLEVKE